MEQQRQSPRQATDLVLDCMFPGGKDRAILCDLSASGCRMELLYGSVDRGTTVIFSVGDWGEFAGQVVWAKGGKAGVRFNKGLPRELRIALELE